MSGKPRKSLAPGVFSWLRIGTREEWRHRWHGRRDGKKGIPVLDDNDGELTPVRPTPHTRTLLSRRDEVIARQLEALIGMVGETCKKIDGHYERVSILTGELADARRDLTEAQASVANDDLSVPGAGERKLPVSTITARRRNEQRKRLKPFLARVAAKEEEIKTISVTIIELEAEVRGHLREVQRRADTYEAHVVGLDMRYWRALTRVHEWKKQLLTRPREWSPPARWTTEPDYRAALDLGPPPGIGVTRRRDGATGDSDTASRSHPSAH